MGFKAPDKVTSEYQTTPAPTSLGTGVVGVLRTLSPHLSFAFALAAQLVLGVELKQYVPLVYELRVLIIQSTCDWQVRPLHLLAAMVELDRSRKVGQRLPLKIQFSL